MTITRILTAIVLCSLLVWLILYPPRWVFDAFITLTALYTAWEWGRLSRIPQPLAVAWLAGLTGLLALLYWLAPMPLQHNIILCAMVWWIGCLLMILRCQARRSLPQVPPTPWLIAGIPSLVPAWLALLLLSQRERPDLLLLLFALIWVMDMGAWWTGKTLGRRRLADALSPEKTWEGLCGGLCAGLLVLGGYLIWGTMSWQQAIGLTLIALLSLCFSVVGDLFESLLKRCAGQKDSGTLLPGHGGLLDRVDSLSAAAPIWVGGLLLGGYMQ